ncbi:formate dehydrogenase accessory sulfurtransferase FdhD [Acidobacteria bacterium AH-259-A15]|nr:formate dehydrogenase accessory sulfurtransferase FdhD [Acidobacteria bacterium AH-259-A15]
MKTPTPAITTRILTIEGDTVERRSDEVAAEEPMEVRVVVEKNGRPVRHSISVTMRTPGHDFELAAGFLFTEGIVTDRGAIREIGYCGATPQFAQHNVVNVFLNPDVPFDPEKFSRNVYTTSSCGICGKTSLEMVRVACSGPPVGTFQVDEKYFTQLPEQLSKAQAVFWRTGGLHASALFDTRGELLILREDVGRHNALDKLVGALFLEERLPASETVVLLSGRASYELVQKALMAGIPALAAVGAPSSLAIDMAREFNMTLIGFLRNGRFNVYTGEHRIALTKT